MKSILAMLIGLFLIAAGGSGVGIGIWLWAGSYRMSEPSMELIGATLFFIALVVLAIGVLLSKWAYRDEKGQPRRTGNGRGMAKDQRRY